MAGHLRRHGKRWQLVWKVEGRQQNVSWPAKVGETQHDAEVRLAVEIGRHLAVQRRRDAQQRTVGDVLDMWYEAREFTRANTIRRLQHQLKRLKSAVVPEVGRLFGDIPADELEPWIVEDLWKVFRHQGLKESTIREYVAPVQTAYTWARKRKVRTARGRMEPLIERDVALAIEEMPLPRRRDVRHTSYHICEWDELLALLDHLDKKSADVSIGASRAAAAAHWMRSGARPSEITGLGWSFVHLDEGYCELVQKTVRIRKGTGRYKRQPGVRSEAIALEEVLKSSHSVRRIGISTKVQAMLVHQKEWQAHWRWKMREEWQNVHNVVYTTHVGGLLAPDDIWREVKLACAALGLPDFRPYDLRHAWKSHMRDESVWTVEDLAAYQGHSRETGEQTYRHATAKAAAKSRRIAEDFDALEREARRVRGQHKTEAR